MNATSYEKMIKSGIRGLSTEAMREIADFVFFMRRREADPESFEGEQIQVLMNQDLGELDRTELDHLEQEFADYESVYPLK